MRFYLLLIIFLIGCKDSVFILIFVTLQSYFLVMEQEKLEYGTGSEVVIDEGKSLLLLNDDVNIFDYVIDTLTKVCGHTYEQAETCALIAHYKGQCAVKSGCYEELEPYYVSLLNHQLYAKIK